MKRRTTLLATALLPLTHSATAGVLDWFTSVTLGATLPDFATWCAPCRTEFPHLNALHEAFAGRGLEVVGLTKEARAVAEAFLPKVDIRYKIGAGGSRPLQAALGIKALPYAILVNAGNRVVWRGQASELAAAEVERFLKAAA